MEKLRSILLPWLRKNPIPVLVAGYEIVAMIVESATGIRCTIPCLYSTVFSVHCPGCGLTNATMALMAGRPVTAWEINPLVYIVLPLLAFCFVSSLRKYSRSLEHATETITNNKQNPNA
jgi:hypothetical protein